MIKMSIIRIVLKMPEVGIQYVSVKMLLYELVLKTVISTSNSNTFICSVSLYSHHVSLFHFSPFPLPRLLPKKYKP